MVVGYNVFNKYFIEHFPPNIHNSNVGTYTVNIGVFTETFKSSVVKLDSKI